MYQKVVIVGNLGRNPEMRYTAGGTPVVHFPVATNRRWTDASSSGEMIPRATPDWLLTTTSSKPSALASASVAPAPGRSSTRSGSRT